MVPLSFELFQSFQANAPIHNLVAQEDLRDALASTYTEFKKRKDEALTLKKQVTDMEAAHTAESSHAARDWRGKEEELQRKCRARGLKINALEASCVHTGCAYCPGRCMLACAHALAARALLTQSA